MWWFSAKVDDVPPLRVANLLNRIYTKIWPP
jgi:hypothetical protein